LRTIEVAMTKKDGIVELYRHGVSEAEIAKKAGATPDM
jgi:hypothetical protein